jgi:hypothetical protein
VTHGAARALDALRAIHDELWDAEVGLTRMAPGVTPGADLRSLNLHAVRETALGAFLDLMTGEVARAQQAIDALLAHQYVATDTPWAGTFKVTAEQADPPADAVEWLHYDPNWRQFIGCILAHTLNRFESLLPRASVDRIEDAVARAVHGEPDGRIPDWYTNPGLMHAWLCGWFGRRCNDSDARRRGDDRLTRVLARLDRYGDVDEYNSPTYDGIDLFAAALWRASPPTDEFAAGGERLVRTIGTRLSALYHPALAAICGPYIRAYGVQLDRYVSLAGEWLALAGADDTGVLPAELTPATDHVHDLYFLPLFTDLGEHVLPHLELQDVTTPRQHEQAFGDAVATSHLTPKSAIGCERGRVHEFARQQYVPFTAHFFSPTANAVAVRLGAATNVIDVDMTSPNTAVVRANARDTVQLIIDASAPLELEGATFTVGTFSIEFAAPPDDMSGSAFAWNQRVVEFVARVDVRPLRE